MTPDIEKLAEKIATKLEGYSVVAVGEADDVIEGEGLDLPTARHLELLKAIDRRVFLCKECGYWFRQIYNATPDTQEWVCKECVS